MNGILLINKPAGITSHDVVYRLRHQLGIERIGHTGTLDPLATGVLVMLLGKATRLAEYLTHLKKTYVATLTLGAVSDTYDAEGIITPRPHAAPAQKTIEEALQRFRGTFLQMPPMFSAIKVKGKKAYELARKGQTIDLKPREVTVEQLDLVDYSYPFVTLKAQVSAGTYIRSLAHDLGQQLGMGAYLSALERTQAGPFHIKQCLSLSAVQHTNLSKSILPPEEALWQMKRLALSETQVKAIQQGQGVAAEALFHDQELIAGMHKNVLVAVLEFAKDSQVIRPVKVL